MAEPADSNFWQRIAMRTNGVATLANLLSITGLLFVLLGAWRLGLGEQWKMGVLLVAFGRCFDILDGYAAELTKTKSRLGGTVDVVCDKLAMIAIVIAVVYAHLVWPWFVVLLVSYNLYLIYFGTLWARVYQLSPNGFAKLSAFVSWLAIFLLVFHSKETNVGFTIGAVTAICIWVIVSVLALRLYRSALRTVIKQKQATNWVQSINDLVCIGNPRATHYHQAHRLLVSLGKVMGKVPLEIDIVDHEHELKELLAARSQNKKMLITVAGGDGTVNTVINTLLQLQTHYKAGECVVLPLWGGNANDFAYMLNGIRMLARPGRLISQTDVVPVPLIKLEVKEPNKSARIIYASCYASFGATAYAARQLEARRFSTKKISQWFPLLLVGHEFVAVVRALLTTPRYTGEIDQKEQVFYDHSLINGPRIAKINRVPVSLGQPYFLHAAITRKDPSVIISLLRMAFGQPAATYSMQSQLSFKLVTSVDAQIDGEVMHLQAGTDITANSVQTTLRFISSKLRDSI